MLATILSFIANVGVTPFSFFYLWDEPKCPKSLIK